MSDARSLCILAVYKTEDFVVGVSTFFQIKVELVSD
jgi:hypothetical protein